MKTYREIVGDIQELFNSTAKDTYIPRRLILSILKTNIKDFMSKKLNDKSLFRELNIFDWIECIDMVEDDIVKCPVIEFRRCNSLMKSKKPLPTLIWSRFGASIMAVTNIDESKKYDLISNLDYINLKKRKNFEKFKGKYAILGSDNHIYIPDSEVQVINVLLFSLDENKFDCSSCSSDDECKSYWDTELNIPDKILSPSIDATIAKVSMRVQIPKDENPDLDSNIKSQTI